MRTRTGDGYQQKLVSSHCVYPDLIVTRSAVLLGLVIRSRRVFRARLRDADVSPSILLYWS